MFYLLILFINVYVPLKSHWNFQIKKFNFFIYGTNNICERLIKTLEEDLNKKSTNFSDLVKTIYNTFELKKFKFNFKKNSKTSNLYLLNMKNGYQLFLNSKIENENDLYVVPSQFS